MATITFMNNAPVAGLAFNPGLEDVLDPTGTITQHTSNLFEITNNDPGPFNGFKFQLISHPTDDFGSGAVPPDTGRIDGIRVRAPDGTIIAEIAPYEVNVFGDTDLVDFYNRILDPNADAQTAIFEALNQLLGESNVVQGSDIGDHLTVFGNSLNKLSGAGGDDVLWSPDGHNAELAGGAGNDILRVEDGTYKVHGGNADGTGGAGETDTLEIVGFVKDSSDPEIERFTNIDVLRFVAGDEPVPPALYGAAIAVSFAVTSIGAENLSTALVVDGSSTASPLSTNEIDLRVGYDPQATTGTSLDLSGWTFTNWNEQRNSIRIGTNSAALALNDTIVGTMVADEIYTYSGDDILRGGGGADGLYGGNNDDTFVYGLNEAVEGEVVVGGTEGVGGDVDKVLVLASNDFSGVDFFGIEQFAFGGAATATFAQDFVDAGSMLALAIAPNPVVIGDANANTIAFQLEKVGSRAPAIDLVDVAFQSWKAGADKVIITGTKSRDDIAGSSEGDLIHGAEGSDFLQGNKGGDAFVFDTGFGKGLDHISDFHRKEGDEIQLENAIFRKLKAGVLTKAAFTTGTEAHDKSDRIIYDEASGALRFDDDGIGKHKAIIFAMLDDAASLKAADFFVI